LCFYFFVPAIEHGNIVVEQRLRDLVGMKEEGLSEG